MDVPVLKIASEIIVDGHVYVVTGYGVSANLGGRTMTIVAADQSTAEHEQKRSIEQETAESIQKQMLAKIAKAVDDAIGGGGHGPIMFGGGV